MDESELLLGHNEAEEPKADPPTLIAKLIIEFIGTFFLVFVVYLTVAQSIHDAKFHHAGLAIGTILAIMIYMGGHISGGHYNPAVTLGIFASGRGIVTAVELGAFVGVQLLAGLIAALLGHVVTDVSWGPAPGAAFGMVTALGVEVIFTFALVSIVLNVATAEASAPNHYYGYAIGLIVFCGATSVGGISGAVFNPAVGTGIILADLFYGGSAANLWIYWVGPCLGGALAAAIFYFTNPIEYKKE